MYINILFLSVTFGNEYLGTLIITCLSKFNKKTCD
jgi:hypothetical protein